jgi:hypothetical protein
VSLLARIRGRWCAFWFRPAPLLDLGIARIVLAAIVFDLNGTMRFLTVGLVSPDLWKPLPWIEAIGFAAPPTLDALMLLSRLTHIALVAVALGLFTNVALAALLVLQTLQEAFLNCFGKTSHGTIPLLYALLFLMLAPCGRAVSLDALVARWWRRRSGAPDAPARTSVHAGWPLDLLFAELAAYYFLAGFAKVCASGLLWADGYTLQYYLLEKQTPAGLWLATHIRLCVLFSALVLAFELSWPLGIVLRRLRTALLGAGLAFHFGTILFLRISFWPVWILYALFVPWSSLLARGRQLVAPRRRPRLAPA